MVSDTYVRLLEKAKLQAVYGLSEAQLRRYFEQASASAGETGRELFRLLESRLDSLVRRLGFARTIAQARQLVLHGHIQVEGRRVSKPGYQLRSGQRIRLSPRAQKLATVQEAIHGTPDVPRYLRRDEAAGEGELIHPPEREEIPLPVPIEDRLVVEHYA